MDLEERLLRTKIVYRGKYVQAEERVVRLPDGTEATREIITPPNAVGILPIDSEGNVYLVRQYRPAIEQITLEIPAGILEPGEAPIDTARRECEEEIKMRPGRLDYFMSYYHSVGFSTGKIDLYLGRDLIAAPQAQSDPGEFLEVIILPFEEAYQLALSGKLIDSKTLLALFWRRQIVQ